MAKPLLEKHDEWQTISTADCDLELAVIDCDETHALMFSLPSYFRRMGQRGNQGTTRRAAHALV